MSNLEKLMIYFLEKFPHNLGRTKLIKAIYLFDCEWYRNFGETFSGLKYERDYNGPFDTDFYEAKDNLCEGGYISEVMYEYPGGKGFEISIQREYQYKEDLLDPLSLNIADEIIGKLKNQPLKTFLDEAYSTEPMLNILNTENSRSVKLLGRDLDMDKLKKSPEPLFNMQEIKEAANNLNTENRGSDEEYNKTIINEMNDLSECRERVERIWQLTGEK